MTAENEVISAYREMGDSVLHAIDYEDVALTPQGVQLLQKGAQAVMRQAVPAMDTDKITPALAVALFVDQLFWDEESGGLIMCAEVAERSYCLPIPKTHWRVRPMPCRIQ